MDGNRLQLKLGRLRRLVDSSQGNETDARSSLRERIRDFTASFKNREYSKDDCKTFVHETDGSEQLAAVDGGVIMCYEGKTPDGKRMRSEVVKEYLENYPLAAKTANGVKDLVDFLSTIAIGSEGKPDVYTTDLGFVSKKIFGAPAKEDIKPGEMIVGQKVAGTLKAYKVAKGVEYEGAPGTVSAQVAGENGAWIIASNEGHPRMIQDGEFKHAYRITKAPEAKAKSNARDM